MYLIADGFANYLFSFYLFSMKFMYNVNKTSSDGRIAPAQFLTDSWATLTYIFKLLIQYRYLCSRGVTPRTRNREVQGSNPVRIFVLFFLCFFSSFFSFAFLVWKFDVLFVGLLVFLFLLMVTVNRQGLYYY